MDSLQRDPWINFPTVWIHSPEKTVKSHPHYAAGKAGDSDSAYQLVKDCISMEVMDSIHAAFEARNPVITSAHAIDVIGASVLTGKPFSANLSLTTETLQRLQTKHGNELEIWWRATFNFGYECLTESEARYLVNTPTIDRIRNQIAAAFQRGGC